MIPHPVNSVVTFSTPSADAISQPRPVSAVTPTADATQSDTPAFTLGQKYLAQMGERLANGFSMVNVAGKWLQMRMPASLNTGDLLELTLIEQAPRLKFLLQTNTPIGSSPTTLSPAGKLIAQLLGQPGPPATRATDHATPLLPAPPATGVEKARLPGQLQQALAISGLFYEAHLARWFSGTRSLQQLRQEPQGRLPATATAADSASASPIAPQTTSLVQQQLHALETGMIQWQGEIWPGQIMEWDIAEHSDNYREKEQTDSETSRKSGCWHTRIRLQLPNLGKITATLMLDPQGVRIRLNTDSAKIRQQLGKEQMMLADAMQATGITIHAMEIQQHEAS